MDPVSQLLNLLHKTIVLPFRQARRLQHLVQHVVEQTAESTSSALSQRAFEKKVREEQMHLDHLEELGKCCVCEQQGQEVDDRRKKDGGMKILEGRDAMIMSAALGLSVRGYLCPTCDSIRTKLKHRLQERIEHEERMQMQQDQQQQQLANQYHLSRGGGGGGGRMGGGSTTRRCGLAAGPLAQEMFSGVTAWPQSASSPSRRAAVAGGGAASSPPNHLNSSFFEDDGSFKHDPSSPRPADAAAASVDENNDTENVISNNNNNVQADNALALTQIVAADSVALTFRVSDVLVFENEQDFVNGVGQRETRPDRGIQHRRHESQPPGSGSGGGVIIGMHHHTRSHSQSADFAAAADDGDLSASGWLKIHRQCHEFRVFFKLFRIFDAAAAAVSSSAAGRHRSGSSAASSRSGLDFLYKSESVDFSTRSSRSSRHHNQEQQLHQRTRSGGDVDGQEENGNDEQQEEIEQRQQEEEEEEEQEVFWKPTTAIPVPNLCGRDCAGQFLFELHLDGDATTSKLGSCKFSMNDIKTAAAKRTAEAGPVSAMADVVLDDANTKNNNNEKDEENEDNVRGNIFLNSVLIHKFIASMGAFGNDASGDYYDDDDFVDGGAAGAARHNLHLPDWVVAALLEHRCDVCRSRQPTLFHKRYRELLCSICKAARRHPRECIALTSRMPDRGAVLALTMTVLHARPNMRADPAFRQSRSLFPTDEDVQLFLRTNHVFRHTALLHHLMKDHRPAGASSASSSSSCASSSVPSSPTPSSSRICFSDATGLLSEAVSDSRRLRTQTLFTSTSQHRHLQQRCCGSDAIEPDLFAESWQAAPAPSQQQAHDERVSLFDGIQSEHPQCSAGGGGAAASAPTVAVDLFAGYLNDAVDESAGGEHPDRD